MRRRAFITLLGGTAAAWPFMARAQQPAMPVVGYLSARTPDGDAEYAAKFRQGLAEAGFVDGRNVTIESRWAAGQYDRFPALAADLIGRGVTVIAPFGTVTTLTVKAATTTIPIVFLTADDPVEKGLVTSFSRPVGNVTGVSMVSSELRPKMIALLRELIPQAVTVVMLVNPGISSVAAQTSATQEAVSAAGLQFQVIEASTPGEIDAAFAKLPHHPGTALLVASDPFLTGQRKQIVSLAARYAMPAVYPWREYPVDGGLMSYGSSNTDAYRQAGVYVARILNGAKPADLPVLQPTKFELVINLKTAKALGLTVPTTLLATADDLIE